MLGAHENHLSRARKPYLARIQTASRAYVHRLSRTYPTSYVLKHEGLRMETHVPVLKSRGAWFVLVLGRHTYNLPRTHALHPWSARMPCLVPTNIALARTNTMPDGHAHYLNGPHLYRCREHVHHPRVRVPSFAHTQSVPGALANPARLAHKPFISRT